MMKKYTHKLYDFTPDQIIGRFLMAVVIGVTIASLLVFLKTAHAINNHPYEDFGVSDDMASYMERQGHGQEFDEGDLQ